MILQRPPMITIVLPWSPVSSSLLPQSTEPAWRLAQNPWATGVLCGMGMQWGLLVIGYEFLTELYFEILVRFRFSFFINRLFMLRLHEQMNSYKNSNCVETDFDREKGWYERWLDDSITSSLTTTATTIHKQPFYNQHKNTKLVS